MSPSLYQKVPLPCMSLSFSAVNLRVHHPNCAGNLTFVCLCVSLLLQDGDENDFGPHVKEPGL
jgi:hypothetical protein